MKKNLYLFLSLALAVSLFSCKNKTAGDGTFTINGTLISNDYNGKTAYLQRTDITANGNSLPVMLDSATVKGNAFSFHGKTAQEPFMATISVDRKAIDMQAPQPGEKEIPFGTLVVESGNIAIKIDEPCVISGTPINNRFSAISQYMKGIDSTRQKIEAMMPNVHTLADSMNISKAMQQESMMERTLAEQCFSFTKENMKTPVGKFAFALYGYLFSNDQALDLIRSADSAFQNTEAMKSLVAKLSVKEPKKGEMYRDFTGMSPQGKEVKLSDLMGKNKYTLIDFWASWCKPCMNEMPTMVKVNRQYKSKGLQIIGVSLDADAKAWTKALKDNHMTWSQLIDAKQEGANAYKVQSIPHTVLLNSKGEIIGVNLRGEILEREMKKLF